MTTVIAPQGKVIVLLDAPEHTSAAGLVVVQDDTLTDTGVVVSTGYADVAEGDHVLLSGKYAGANIVVDGTEYVVVVPDEILAVLG